MLRVEALTKRFGATTAVEDLTLEVERGEFLSLLGPSGCGKTTTLRMIAGFEIPTSGKVNVEGRDVTRLPPQRRGFGMVFQNYALFPHLDVFENVAFGLKAQRVPRGDHLSRVERALERVDLVGYEKRPVQALSGGQQQRVALARALAPEPPLLLLDEPLSNLDAALRERTREELRTLLKRVGITSIFVTHDQEEAFALSDRIAVMRDGRLQQVGTPEELYRLPANPFVASFVGRTNFLEARLVAGDGQEGTVEVVDGVRWRVRVHGAAAETGDGRVRVMVRPESLRLSRGGAGPGAGGLAARVLERRFAGAVTVYRLEVGGVGELVATVPGHGAPLEGEVSVAADNDPPLHAFPVEST
ncbi:MAG TPA: ABC transporter ATP-binding protein [Longimicrobiales bacterium]|nr:ABC transporter ATP-binding protein [Longimicrobiales bacterium]